MDRPLVIQTEDLDDEPAAWLAERCRLVRCPAADPLFCKLIPDAAGLIVRTYTRVDDALLARATSLKVVGRAGVGLENIDQNACRRRGIRVVSTPDANTTAVAEYVFALMLDALRPRLYLNPPPPSQEQWHDIRRRTLALRELNELTLGLWGMGRVGRAVARIAAGFQMRTIYNDLVEVPREQRWGGHPVDVDRLLAESDVLSIHVDGRPSNRNLISPPILNQMRPDILLINTSRGFVVDAAALAAFLRAHPAAGALLDVHDPEPIEPRYPLLAIPNARLAPHLASGTASAKRRMSWVVREVWAVLSQNAAPAG